MSGETFSWHRPMIGSDSGPHAIGDLNCTACCGCGEGQPEPCETCGGVLHRALDDEVENGDDWQFVHSSRCDRPCTCPDCPVPDPREDTTT